MGRGLRVTLLSGSGYGWFSSTTYQMSFRNATISAPLPSYCISAKQQKRYNWPVNLRLFITYICIYIQTHIIIDLSLFVKYVRQLLGLTTRSRDAIKGHASPLSDHTWSFPISSLQVAYRLSQLSSRTLVSPILMSGYRRVLEDKFPSISTPSQLDIIFVFSLLPVLHCPFQPNIYSPNLQVIYGKVHKTRPTICTY